MSQLIKLELNKALRNKWFVVALAIACALACTSAVLGAQGAIQWSAAKDGGSYEWIVLTTQGSFGRWMLSGSDVARELFFLLVPLLVIIPYATSLRSEQVEGILAQMYVRGRRGHYLVAKGFATFLTGFLVVALPLVLNFLVLSCFLPGYIPEAVDSLYTGIGPREAFADLLYGAPLAYVTVNVLVDGTLCGAWALLVLAVSTLVDNRVVLLAGSYLFLIIMKYLNGVVFHAAGINGFRFDLMGLLQGAISGYVREVVPLFAILATMLLLGVGLLHIRKDGDVL